MSKNITHSSKSRSKEIEDPKRSKSSKIQRDRRSKEIEDPKRSKIQRDRRSTDPDTQRLRLLKMTRETSSIITQAIAFLSILTTEASPVDVDDDEAKKIFLKMAAQTTKTNTATKTIRRIRFIPLNSHVSFC